MTNRRLFSGVVAGIAHYGNCFGIPTVAGEVYFDKTYEGNPLVNAFCLGVLRHEQITRGAAKGVGNANDLVGRYFMEHFEIVSAEMTLESAPSTRIFQYPGRGRKGQRAELALQGTIQRKYRILNGTASPQGGPMTGRENSRFASFCLKNLHEWTDRVEQTSKGAVTLVFDKQDAEA